MKPPFSLRITLGSISALLFTIGMTGCVSPGNGSALSQEASGGQWVLQPNHSAGALANNRPDPGRWRSVVSPLGDAPGERDLEWGSPWRWEWIPSNPSSAGSLAGQ